MPIGFAFVMIDMPTKPDRVLGFRAFKLPSMALREPGLRLFNLLALRKALFEQPVFIADAIAERRNTQGCKRIHETGRQTAQATIAQRRIRLVVHDGVVILP